MKIINLIYNEHLKAYSMNSKINPLEDRVSASSIWEVINFVKENTEKKDRKEKRKVQINFYNFKDEVFSEIVAKLREEGYSEPRQMFIRKKL